MAATGGSEAASASQVVSEEVVSNAAAALDRMLGSHIMSLRQGLAASAERAVAACLKDLGRVAKIVPDLDMDSLDVPQCELVVEVVEGENDEYETLFDACQPSDAGGYTISKATLMYPVAWHGCMQRFHGSCGLVRGF